MRTITAAKKSAPKFIDDTHVQVTREFAKNARIFGTPEYKLWKEIRKDCPKAEMVLKTIKTKQNKIIETKNMTYENMAAYIREQTNAKDLMSELKLHIEKSKVRPACDVCRACHRNGGSLSPVVRGKAVALPIGRAVPRRGKGLARQR